MICRLLLSSAKKPQFNEGIVDYQILLKTQCNLTYKLSSVEGSANCKYKKNIFYLRLF